MPNKQYIAIIKEKECDTHEYTPTNIVKALKGGSARLFLKNHPEIKYDKFWGGHIWSRSYYMSTLGNMSKEVVAKYIQNQYSK